MATAVISQYSSSDLAGDVRAGLLRAGQKELPSKYLYDEIGSELFEVISVLPEYGLTRADERLLRRHASDIVSRLGAHVLVAELGSGSGKKTRWLLEALARRQRTTYCPIEISRTALARCESELGQIECVSIVGFERPYLDGLEYTIIRNVSTAILTFVSGKLDITFGGLSVPLTRDVQNQAPQAVCELNPTNVSRNLVINRDVAPFDYHSLRTRFKGAYIANNGYDFELATRVLAANEADLIAFGKPFIANPDLVERLKRGAPLNAPDKATFYGGGAKGYTDYPVLGEALDAAQ